MFDDIVRCSLVQTMQLFQIRVETQPVGAALSMRWPRWEG